MHACHACDQPLDAVRFCHRCGAEQASHVEPADRRRTTDERVRPLVATVTEPPAPWFAPGPARYPLYAGDELPRVEADPAVAEPPAWEDPDAAWSSPPGAHRAAEPVDDHHLPAHLVVLAAGVVALVLLALAMAAVPSLREGLLGRDTASSAAGTATGGAASRGASSAPEASRQRPVRSTARPTGGVAGSGSAPSGGASVEVPAGAPQPLASQAALVAPPSTPDGTDVSGMPVGFGSANLVDGDPSTAWRTAGDATGDTIDLTFAEPRVLTSVGLVNGYAKTAAEGSTTYDWYHGNRRVLVATWTFDDGSSVTQQLADTTAMQVLDVGAVRTRSVVLTLTSVSAPGTGVAGRDNTAIGELDLEGYPA